MPDISFWNKCNNKCIMCTNPKDFLNSNPIGNYDIKTQIKKINLYLNGIEDTYYSNRDRKDYINITGGEPTIHPNFFYLIDYISKKIKNIPITLLTNGKKFADEEFTKRFAAISNENFVVAISFHTYNKTIFEKITGVKNSYEQTLKGIINLSKYFKGKIEIRIVIHKLNINDILQTLIFIKDLFIAHKNWYCVLIHYEIEGIGEINKNKIKLSLTDSSRIIAKIPTELFNLINIRLYHFPLCILKRELRKYAWKTLSKDEIVYTEKCKTCKKKKNCIGLMKRYYELYGDSELKTIR